MKEYLAIDKDRVLRDPVIKNTWTPEASINKDKEGEMGLDVLEN